MLPVIDFAQGSLHHSTIRITPLNLVNGYKPRTSFNWKPLDSSLPAERLSYKKATKIVERIEEGIKFI